MKLLLHNSLGMTMLFLAAIIWHKNSTPIGVQNMAVFDIYSCKIYFLQIDFNIKIIVQNFTFNTC